MTYRDALIGRTVLWRPEGVEDWCHPAVKEATILLTADHPDWRLVRVRYVDTDMLTSVSTSDVILGRKLKPGEWEESNGIGQN